MYCTIRYVLYSDRLAGYSLKIRTLVCYITPQYLQISNYRSTNPFTIILATCLSDNDTFLRY